MTSQVQHAQRIVAMVDSYMDGKPSSTSMGGSLYVRDICERFGFSKLGDGNFGFAIKHPENPDLAIKVVLGCAQYHKADRKVQLSDGYMDYVAACMLAPKSKYLPEFHAAIVGKFCAVVVMKKYKNCYDGPDGGHGAECFRDIVRDIPDDGLDFVKGMLGRFSDVHTGNFMWCDDVKSFVVTDPYAEHGRSKAPCERWIGKDGVLTVDVEFNHAPSDRLNMHDIRKPDMPEFGRMRKMMLDQFMVPSRFLRPVERMVDQEMQVRVEKQRHMHVKAMDFMVLDDHFDIEARNMHVRRELVDHSEKPTLRQQEKDHVLRLKSEHDCGARIEGVSGALLPRLQPWWLPAAWAAKLKRPSGPKERDREPTDKPVVRAA